MFPISDRGKASFLAKRGFLVICRIVTQIGDADVAATKYQHDLALGRKIGPQFLGGGQRT